MLNTAPAAPYREKKVGITPRARNVTELMDDIKTSQKDKEKYQIERGNLMVSCHEIIRIIEAHNGRDKELLRVCKELVQLLAR
jgi:hypothetical protein